MKPLREEFDRNDPNEVAGAALLARVPPLEPSSARQHRVRFALRGSRAKMALRFSPAFAAGIVILGATGASAMVARYFVRAHLHAPEVTAPAPEPVERSPRAASARGRHQGATPGSIDEPAVPESSEGALPGPLSEPIQKAEPAPAPAKQVLPKAHAAKPELGAGVQASTPGSAIMVEAMQARRSGDMARAASLLAEYRSKYPDGALQEEALALSIEAAVARGDDGTQRFAAQYLKRYPNGRFREQAERALKSTTR